MNINPATLRNVYKTGSVAPRKSVKAGNEVDSFRTALAASSENTDRIQISSQATQQKYVSDLAKGVMKGVEEESAPDKLDEIRGLIQSNSYFVSSGDLADAILNRVSWE